MIRNGRGFAQTAAGVLGSARAIVGTVPLLIGRLRRDLLPLLGVVALLAVAAVIAIAVPRNLELTLDRAAGEAVSSAGSDADLLLSAPVGGPSGSGGTTAERLTAYAGDLASRLPPALADVLSTVSTGILGPALPGTTVIGPIDVQIGVLEPSARSFVEPVAGVLPIETTAPSEGIPVVLSSAAAEVAGLIVGDTIELAGASADIPVRAEVVGLVEPSPTSDAPWADLPNLWTPLTPESPRGSAGIQFTVLTSAGAFDSISGRLPAAASGVIRVTLDPERTDFNALTRVVHTIDALETSASSITEGAPLAVSASSGIEDAVADFPVEAGAASTQLSALGAGVLGVAALLVVLAYTALGARRTAEIRLLRSRGASLGLLLVHAELEAVGVMVIGIGAGAGVTIGTVGAPSTPTLLLGLAAIALVTPAMVAVGPVATDRTRRHRGLLRAAAAATVITLAGAALIALRSRELDSAAGVDPLALSAPVLCAVVIALAISPLPALLIRPLRAAVTRTRGAGSLIAVTSTGQSSSVLTLTTLTLAVSVAITSLVLAESVASSQADTAWQTVGADVRFDTVADPERAVAALENAGAVAAAVEVVDGVELQDDTHSSNVTLLAVDARYADLLEAMPRNRSAHHNIAAVEDLTDGPAEAASHNDSVPALVDGRLNQTASGDPLFLQFENLTVPLRVLDADIASPGFPTGSVVIVDQAALANYSAAHSSEPVGPAAESTVLAVGTDAAAVVIGTTSTKPLERQAVLDSERSGAIASGVSAATHVSLVAAGVLAVIGVLLISVLGARRRGRTLALLGTLGVPRRSGIVAAFGELAPVVTAALAGGAVASVAVLAVAGQAFGVGAPGGSVAQVVVPWATVIGIAAVSACALALAVLVDAPLSRRTRATTILRSGEDS